MTNPITGMPILRTSYNEVAVHSHWHYLMQTSNGMGRRKQTTVVSIFVLFACTLYSSHLATASTMKASMTLRKGAVRTRRQRHAPTKNSVECLYAMKTTRFADHTSQTIHQCITTDQGHVHSLPNGLVDPATFLSGQTKFKLHGVTIRQNPESNTNTLDGLENAIVEVIERQSRRKLMTTTGIHKVLAVRVTARDGVVDYDRNKIGQFLFGNGKGSVKTTYGNCSYGKLTMVPYQGRGVVNGVVEMLFNNTVVGKDAQAVENNLTDQIRRKYGMEGVSYDHIMIFLPPGTISDNSSSWLAYSYIDQFRSVFDNQWGGYLSSLMHELGHTLGLRHSGRKRDEYGDTTGFMGYSTASYNSPAKCFNGHKHYVLGWYYDRTLEVLPSSLPWTGVLVAFVDYKNAKKDEPVLIKVDDLYLQYNRAKSFNSQNKQNRDEVTITQALNAISISWAVGSVSMSNTTYTITNYNDGPNDLIIEVCSQQNVSYNGRADWYRLSIYLDFQASGCASTLSTELRPTPAPSSSSPGTVTEKPTSVPTIRNVTPPPTYVKYSAPTMAPTTTIHIGGGCVDRNTTFRYKGADRSCQWLKARPSIQKILCHPVYIAYRNCPLTCKALCG